MKNFIKAPENWGKSVEAATPQVKSLSVEPNRARIEAKIAEIKAKLAAKK